MGHLRSKLTGRAVITGAAATAVIWAGSATAAWADARADLAMGFTTRSPGAPTGLNLAVEYKNPSDPAAKPPALEAAEFDLPAGTRIDQSVVPKCTASDEEIQARGRNACPPETMIGTGRLVAITGAGPPVDPFDGESLFFNGDGEIVEIVVVRGSDASAGFDRIGVAGSKLTAHPPALPGGPPDGSTAIKRVELTVPAPPAGARPYLTTPGACPPDEFWRGSGSFRFGDGGSTTVPAPVPCTAAASRKLRLHVSPTTVLAGHRAQLRVRVSSAAAGCAAGASVRLGRARAVTNTSGRAVLHKFLSRSQLVTVRASKPGCGRATARVRVR
jgi:hypothetical protein